jgi:hypothetical protein
MLMRWFIAGLLTLLPAVAMAQAQPQGDPMLEVATTAYRQGVALGMAMQAQKEADLKKQLAEALAKCADACKKE